jgi:hypothetical protein
LDTLPYLAILTSVVAAVLGIRAATIPWRDTVDHMVADLRKQGRWSSWAAAAAGVSVVLQAMDRLLS